VPGRAVVPVLGIFQIALLQVQQAMQPGRQHRIVTLDEVVGLVPAAGAQQRQGMAKVRHGHGLLGGFGHRAF